MGTGYCNSKGRLCSCFNQHDTNRNVLDNVKCW